MRPIKAFLLITGLLMTMTSYGDVIISGTHYVEKCIKITNLADYPDISLLGIIYELQGGIGEAYVVNPDVCLQRGYRMCKFEVYAVKNDYLAGRNLLETEWEGNENAFLSSIQLEPYKGYVYDSNPLNKIEEYYKIAGFANHSVVLYKWKEINKYNNGLEDSVKTFEYDGDIHILSQQIPAGIHTPRPYSDIRVYPNPAKGSLTIGSIASFNGDIRVELFNVKGKVVKIFLLEEAGNNTGYLLNVSKLPRGMYFLKIHLGEYTEVRKVIIQ
jgi:hypothetical protein